ncbi:MAG: rod shape-determining protein [Patescibacteria group bacterium]|nr:rod shape-determining protein [Patescibacteria group bacterium]
MKEKNDKNYKYLLRLYSVVGEYLFDVPTKQEDLPEIVVSFCIVTEKILKIKLHDENPVLVYENTKIKENDSLVAIIKGKELNIETIRIRETLDRYKLMFKNDFSDDEMQVLIDIYKVRNHFVHGYKSDAGILSDRENIVKKIGTVWEKISTQAISIFGKDLIKANKPKKKYSEEELEKVLIEEVKTKITPIKNTLETMVFGGLAIPMYTRSSAYGYSITGEECPRCGAYDFSLDGSDSDIFPQAASLYGSSRTFSDLYKCKKCNLELTKKEYEIAKKLK